ncbi:hypothetical protein MLD38_027383 [Melastoma candidum]|uniref:Uncharacterized protein n=1 Tax=Melastoma candidum TaxID=119954 RepID=A0ACB9P1K1_9MYRT|nr:hypothetical protein MLD38_027383 [Melastoma candidum]
MAPGTMERSYYEVLGLCCATEVPLVEKLLRPLEGVDQVSVIVATKTVIVVHDPTVVSRSDIADALNKARMEASLRPGPGEIQSATSQWPSPYTITCGVLFGLSFLKYVYQPLKWFALAAVIVGAPPILIRGLASIKNFTLNINVLVLISDFP